MSLRQLIEIHDGRKRLKLVRGAVMAVLILFTTLASAQKTDVKPSDNGTFIVPADFFLLAASPKAEFPVAVSRAKSLSIRVLNLIQSEKQSNGNRFLSTFNLKKPVWPKFLDWYLMPQAAFDLRSAQHLKKRTFQNINVSDALSRSIVPVALPGPGGYLVEIKSKLTPVQGEPFAKSKVILILATDLAIHVKRGEEKSLVWITHVDTSEPVEGVNVAVFSCGRKFLTRATTDKDGLAFLQGLPPRHLNRCKPGDREKRLFFVAEKASDYSFVVSDDYEQKDEKNSIEIFSFFDRESIASGQTLRMKHNAREYSFYGPRIPPLASLPKHVQIRHEDQNVSFTIPLVWTKGGVSLSEWVAPPNIPTGRYDLVFVASNQKTKKNKTIEGDSIHLRDPLVLSGEGSSSGLGSQDSVTVPAEMRWDWDCLEQKGSLAVTLPKESIAPGSSAMLTLGTSDFFGTALITLEREGVLNSYVQNIASPQASTSLPITLLYAPSVHVTAMSVAKRSFDDQQEKKTTHFRLGSSWISVDTKLVVKVESAKQVFRASEIAEVTLRARRPDRAPFNSGTGAVAVVSQSSKNYDRHRWNFYNTDPKNIKTNLVQTISNYGFFLRKNSTLLSIPETFEDVLTRRGRTGNVESEYEREDLARDTHSSGWAEANAISYYWNPAIALNDRGVAKIQIKMPDVAGEYSIIAAATEGAAFFGSGFATVTVESTK